MLDGKPLLIVEGIEIGCGSWHDELIRGGPTLADSCFVRNGDRRTGSPIVASRMHPTDGLSLRNPSHHDDKEVDYAESLSSGLALCANPLR